MFTILLYILLISADLARCVAVPAELLTRNDDAMTIERTCRWSNCDERCPVGFVVVPRTGKGARKDEDPIFGAPAPLKKDLSSRMSQSDQGLNLAANGPAFMDKSLIAARITITERSYRQPSHSVIGPWN
ncbi:hypothetical protein SNOG_12405 [Parastagonospora nodorum SN15]|uniref:4Fe-4S ferredoxin-type domain-containing protein n=1 Tax=Phaeosphaeria nodorum (strain SN15 / ATCC MYA-4574 / FGSC 10173) TaxID=321614 RepID=Q0U759_PHANO|nr:hypothetical protein SNOG_12405 [Parastagonospora nodorum SN15]EAT80218.1 hypothetical protein SNOG_12405 [Parastagonospora nodorum SN15]